MSVRRGAVVRSVLAVVPHPLESNHSGRPDISWIRKNIPILEVGKALGLRIHHRRAQCWRPENHRHGDADPSLHFYERGNRVRCFVCDDMRGGHSCIDLVMGVLGMDVRAAVRWIAERFPVPNVKAGRPLGRHSTEPTPYRVGVHGSELEVLVRSGVFGQLSAAESRILVTLAVLRDAESGISKMSYQAIMRYSGVARRAGVSHALKQLQKLHAIQISRGSRIGITRECSTYRVTLDDPKFLELCNKVYKAGREEVARERAYRAALKKDRDRRALQLLGRRPERLVTPAGGLRPPTPPVFLSKASGPSGTANPVTCEGLNLSSLGELNANKSVPIRNREIRFLSEKRRAELELQKKIILERYAREQPR